MKKVRIIIILCCFALPLRAQEQRSTERQAEEFYWKQEYARAASLYERVAKKKRVKTQTLERLAESYRQINAYGPAAQWYGALLQRPDASPTAALYYADMLKSQGKYAEAKTAYAAAAQKTGSTPLLEDRIAGCDAALQWMEAPSAGRVDNVARLNSGLSDWGATWYPKGLVFMSDSLRRDLLEPGSRAERNLYGRNKHPFFKLYVADTGRYGQVYVSDLSAAFNRYKYHVGPITFDSTFRAAYFTVTEADRRIARTKEKFPHGFVIHGNRRLELMMSTRDSSGRWRAAEAFPYNKPAEYSVGHAALSRDGSTLYFVSDMPGGLGGTDIWFSERQADGQWGTPQHAGPAINTPGDEAFPTVGPDGTLYFSSKGGIGMGGFDIFSATGSKANWSRPKNMQYPLNSPGDDFYFVTGSGGSGYFSSNRAGGKGDDDIYSWAGPAPDAPERVFVPGLQIPLKVNVCPPYRGACIYLYNKKRGIGWCFSAASEGSFTTKLEPDTAYELRIHTARGTDTIQIDTRGMTEKDVIEKEYCPQQ